MSQITLIQICYSSFSRMKPSIRSSAMRHKNILAHEQNNEKFSMHALPQRSHSTCSVTIFRILTKLGLEHNALPFFLTFLQARVGLPLSEIVTLRKKIARDHVCEHVKIQPTSTKLPFPPQSTHTILQEPHPMESSA
jgi:hypothetical protein